MEHRWNSLSKYMPEGIPTPGQICILELNDIPPRILNPEKSTYRRQILYLVELLILDKATYWR